MRVTADRSVCIGSGNCSFAASEMFEQDEDTGIVTVLTDAVPTGLEEAAREAVLYCPSGALTLHEE